MSYVEDLSKLIEQVVKIFYSSFITQISDVTSKSGAHKSVTCWFHHSGCWFHHHTWDLNDCWRHLFHYQDCCLQNFWNWNDSKNALLASLLNDPDC